MNKIFVILFLISIVISCKQEKNSINTALKKQLAEIEFRDQALRKINSETPQDSIKAIAKKLNLNPDYFKHNYRSVSIMLDAENIKKIEKIIAKYGYPGKSLVGIPENETAWIIIQHSNKIDKYLPLIRDAATKGDVSKQALAMMEDRNLMNHGKEQIYGSQAFSVNNKNIIWPIKNPEKVNDLRKEAGFVQSIQEYSKTLYGQDFQYKIYTLEEVKKLQNF